MLRLTDELTLSREQVTLYYANDAHLANLPVFIFHGPSITTNSTLNSSRIQIHVFSAAGFQSYPRITISPNSTFYQSVNHLPRDKQGDEICRGLAFGLLKYFKELPEVVKSGLILQSASIRGKRIGPPLALFGEQHAAEVASSMIKADNTADVIQAIEAALQPQSISHIDVDLVLPPSSITPLEPSEDENEEDLLVDPSLKQYGGYSSLVKLFGEIAFLPTSKLRRAPSKQTSLNRSKSFSKDCKLSLRREMGELVDTEERYVIKMHELVNHIADEFRVKAKARAFGSFSPSEEDLQKLFPPSLDRILQVNSAFLADIRSVMDKTNEEAMRDLEATVVSSVGSRHNGNIRDPTGALAFAKVLLEWFPKFSSCYQEYIRASQEFPQIISTFMKQQSSFSQRVQQSGEQRLRSAVIEPVQRLPRYSLFIDNIVNYLPIAHPALSSMLKARDIITCICSLDPPLHDKPQIVGRLRHLVESWPASLQPQGRLITAVDVLELQAPFLLPKIATSYSGEEGILLLFADCVVILKKTKSSTLSARGLLAEVDNPSAAALMASVTAVAGGQKHLYDLSFTGWHTLSDTRFTISGDARSVWMTSLQEMKESGMSRERPLAPTVRCFFLQGAYETKALRLSEEVSKARIEGRFPETERESGLWCMRAIRLDSGLHLHTAVFQQAVETFVKGRKEPAPVRIVVDREKGTKGAPVGHYGIEIIANLSVSGNGAKYIVEVDGLHDKAFVDDTSQDLFMATLSKRVADLLRSQYHISNPNLTLPSISFYMKILKAINCACEGDKAKPSRPHSPVKMLSNLFNSSTSSLKETSSISSNTLKPIRAPTLNNIPSITSNSRAGCDTLPYVTPDLDPRRSVCAALNPKEPSNPLIRLEETFIAYIGALKSRKGSMVGRVLRNRASADELAVNALYNTFIENPYDTRASSEAAVDVIFAAFEKFLRMAWREQMGDVIPTTTLELLQEKALKLFPGDFSEYVRTMLGEMAPQNRRAFIAITKLLADLLAGCGNDGDRGALTAAFVELIIIEGQPHEHINLLDRMVEDAERLFEDIGPGAIQSSGTYSAHGSINGHRSNKSATGSLTSNASSLRRRFADTLLRQNSKQDSDRPSVWRTLSKTSRSVATGDVMVISSLSKAPLNRSRSIESNNRRPVSRDRPTVMGAFDERPSSSHGQPSRLSTIGASPPPEDFKSTESLKKHRRSSLSDLKSLMAAATLGENSPLSASANRMVRSSVNKFNSSPRAPSPTKIPTLNCSPSPTKDHPMLRLNNNGTSSLSSRQIRSLTERPQNIMSNPGPDSPPKQNKPASTSSNIPTFRGRELTPTSRPTTSAGSKSSSPQKFRLQSPQKLRERLQNEARAINDAEASLQTELSKIGAEMAALHSPICSNSEKSDTDKLYSRIRALESRISAAVKGLEERNETIKLDLEQSLQASEFKVKGLDQLWREGTAENELLYEKFNTELGKIVKALRKGRGAKELADSIRDTDDKDKEKEGRDYLVQRMKEGVEETARVKKENARLRREVLTLRTLLKGGE